MASLQAQYDRQQRDYGNMVFKARQLRTAVELNKEVERIRAQNQKIQATIDQMMAVLAKNAKSTTELESVKQKLLTRLQELKEDYNELLANNDKLETLKRIRGYEQTKQRTTIQMYLLGLVGALVLLFIVILFKGSQRSSVATNPMPKAAAATPSLT